MRKLLKGMRTRVMAKVAAVTVLQYLNQLNWKPLNDIKSALAT